MRRGVTGSQAILHILHIQAGKIDLDQNWVRLAPNGTNPWFFSDQIQYILARRNYSMNSQSILNKFGTHIYNSIRNKFCSLRSIQISISLEWLKKTHNLPIIYIFQRAITHSKIVRLTRFFFYRFRTFQVIFFCSLSVIAF